MTYDQLLTEVKKLKCLETRTDSKSELEFVIKANDVSIINSVLQNYFGPPLKPAGQEPTKEAWNYTVNLGGIRENQTLYYVKREEVSYCAMIWPWSNKVSITVKIFQL